MPALQTMPVAPTVPLLTVPAPDLQERARAAWQATQIPPAALAGTPADPTRAGQALRVLLQRLLQREVPLPTVPYVQVGPCLFSVCWVAGAAGAEYTLSLVQPCSTASCVAEAFSAPIRSLADVGTALRPGGRPPSATCAAAESHAA